MQACELLDILFSGYLKGIMAEGLVCQKGQKSSVQLIELLPQSKDRWLTESSSPSNDCKPTKASWNLVR
jgi:hypothetical protein